MPRFKYLWCKVKKAWVPPHEVSRETVEDKSCPRYSFQIMSKGDGERWNAGLGCRQKEVKDNLKRLAGEKGINLVEVGNDKPTATSNQNSYELTRDDYQKIINQV